MTSTTSPLLIFYTDENMVDATIVASNSIRLYSGLNENEYRLVVFLMGNASPEKFDQLGIATRRFENTTAKAQGYSGDHRNGQGFQTSPSANLAIWNILYEEGENRVITLDADLFCVGNLKGLVNVDLGEYALGACSDTHLDNHTLTREDQEHGYRMHPRNCGAYFNTGVLVMDLQRYYPAYGFDKKEPGG